MAAAGETCDWLLTWGAEGRRGLVRSSPRSCAATPGSLAPGGLGQTLEAGDWLGPDVTPGCPCRLWCTGALWWPQAQIAQRDPIDSHTPSVAWSNLVVPGPLKQCAWCLRDGWAGEAGTYYVLNAYALAFLMSPWGLWEHRTCSTECLSLGSQTQMQDLSECLDLGK